MRVLVVGGAGFIGSHLVDALVAKGHQVCVFDNFSTGKWENLRHHVDQIQVVEGDFREAALLGEVCRGMDVVFHQAAVSSVIKSMENPLGTFDVNVTGTLKLLEAATKAGVQKFVFASSAAVYGQRSDFPASEKMKPKPISLYGTTKLLCEHLGQLYATQSSMQVTCLRYFNVFGSRQTKDSQYSGVISIFVDNLLQNKPLVIFGDGEQTRDFVHVKDIVQANLLAMEPQKTASEDSFRIFNVARGSQISISEMVSTLQAITQKSLNVEYREERRGDLRHSQGEIEKISSLLGYCPKVSFEEGLTELIAFCKQEIKQQAVLKQVKLKRPTLLASRTFIAKAPIKILEAASL